MANGRTETKKLSQYDKGFRDGYLEGLSECSPISGFTKWFKRRSVTKKLGQMKEAERHAVVAEALAEYESEGHGAKKRLLNPSSREHKRLAKEGIAMAKKILAKARGAKGEARARLLFTTMYYAQAAVSDAAGAHDEALIEQAGLIRNEAENLVRRMCGFKQRNPSEAASGALGGVAGGLLLGPLGAAAGAYGGVKLKERAESKKRARSRARGKAKKPTKNPSVRQLVRDALK